jgi:hypothetical protein
MGARRSPRGRDGGVWPGRRGFTATVGRAQSLVNKRPYLAEKMATRETTLTDDQRAMNTAGLA